MIEVAVLIFVSVYLFIKCRHFCIGKMVDREFSEKCREMIEDMKMVEPTPRTCVFFHHQLVRLHHYMCGEAAKLWYQKVERKFQEKFGSSNLPADDYTCILKEIVHAEKSEL